MTMKRRAVTGFVAVAVILMFIAGPALSASAATMTSDYKSGYAKAYPLFYKDAKKIGQEDARAGRSNQAVDWASKATYECYTKVTSMSGEKLRGACDGAMIGAYEGYNDGYKGRAPAQGETETEAETAAS